jgi:GntR family transcriptional regulator, trigonelline degradation regulator
MLPNGIQPVDCMTGILYVRHVADTSIDLGGPDGKGLSLGVQRVAAPLREQVLDLLRQAIVEHRLKPGQRLIERELVEQIGVSRTTIREVLRQLAAEGLVATIPQRGAVVAVPTAEEALELYEVRGALESLAARRFVEHASDSQVQALRAAFGQVEAVMSAGDDTDVLEMIQAKDLFYDILLKGSGNRAIHSILSGLTARVSVLRATSMSQPGRALQSVEEIRAIVEAIEARDADAAAQAAAHHVAMASRAGQAASPDSPE